jgi:cytochrome c oxidase subunit 2
MQLAPPMNCPTSACAGTLIPGQMIEVAITPTKEGRHHFLCDNFCGDGHDRMSGILVVAAG